MKALALDFDGVISDSAPEAFVVAVRAFCEEFPDGGVPPEGEQDEALFARFLEIMPLGNRAEDYGVALSAIGRSVALEDQDAYDAFYATLDRARLKSFHKRFYKVRHAWTEADPAGWFARIQPYAAMPDWIARRSRDVQLAVATAKDKRSVSRLLERYGLAEYFGEGWVHDKETGVSKRAHIAAIAERAGCPPSEIVFIDDKVNHLIDVAETGARCVLAGWGYNSRREHEVAAQAGLEIATLETLDGLLFPG